MGMVGVPLETGMWKWWLTSFLYGPVRNRWSDVYVETADVGLGGRNVLPGGERAVSCRARVMVQNPGQQAVFARADATLAGLADRSITVAGGGGSGAGAVGAEAAHLRGEEPEGVGGEPGGPDQRAGGHAG